MWEVLFVVAVVVAGKTFGNEDCNVNPVLRCMNEDFFPKVPDNEQEVLAMCESFKSKTECALYYMENCGGEENKILKLRKVLSYVEENCRNGSSIYQDGVQALECIKPIFSEKYTECTKTDDVKAMKFFIYLMELSERGITDASDSENDKMKCLDSLYYDACSSAEVGKKCGYDARNAIVDILRNLDSKLMICNDEIVNDMINLVVKFESDP